MSAGHRMGQMPILRMQKLQQGRGSAAAAEQRRKSWMVALASGAWRSHTRTSVVGVCNGVEWYMVIGCVPQRSIMGPSTLLRSLRGAFIGMVDGVSPIAGGAAASPASYPRGKARAASEPRHSQMVPAVILSMALHCTSFGDRRGGFQGRFWFRRGEEVR